MVDKSSSDQFIEDLMAQVATNLRKVDHVMTMMPDKVMLDYSHCWNCGVETGTGYRLCDACDLEEDNG